MKLNRSAAIVFIQMLDYCIYICYPCIMIQKAFTVGNSVVLTVPAKAGIKPGTKVRFIKSGKKKLVYEVLEDFKALNKDAEVEDYLNEVTGAFKLADTMNTEDLMARIKELEENPYDHSIRFS